METSRKRARFKGSIPGRSQPKGKVTLPVTFGGELNYRTERIIFDVAEIPLPYNGILGRPALAKFMAASHYAYNMLKMPGPLTIIPTWKPYLSGSVGSIKYVATPVR